MATLNDWMEGARVRTLPASLSPVILGAGIAGAMGKFSVLLTVLAAGVALFFQIGANFANDYSDGIRGTDEFRQGPPRLTGGGKVSPEIVKHAAFIAFGIGCLFGVLLVWLSGHWWLLIAGVAALLAAWFYTGGKHPYGYAGLGEVFVLIFFGYMATMGTVYTQTDAAPLAAWLLATGIGLIACALLMVNNVRDIPTDQQAGKHTLAVRLGEKRARWAYYGFLAIAVVLAAAMYLWGFTLLMGMLGMLVWVVYLSRPVIGGATGHALLPVLRNTGLFELTYAIAVAVGMVVSVYWPHMYWTIAGWAIAGLAWLGFALVEIVAAIKGKQSATDTTDTAETTDTVETTDAAAQEAAPADDAGVQDAENAPDIEDEQDTQNAEQTAPALENAEEIPAALAATSPVPVSSDAETATAAESEVSSDSAASEDDTSAHPNSGAETIA